MNTTDIAYAYNQDANPEGLHLEGVPLRDLAFADLDRLSQPLREALAAQPFYTLVVAPPAVLEPPAKASRRPPLDPNAGTNDPGA